MTEPLVVLPSAWVTQPWRNGGGITHEVFRDGALDAFRVRVSVADVVSDGPFSRFVGIDRWITLLEGRGFRLEGESGRSGRVEHAVDAPFVPFAFSGDDAIHCALLDGPVRDLNVMVDRAAVEATVDVVVLEGARTFVAPRSAGSSLLVFVLEGSVTLAACGDASSPVALPRHALASASRELMLHGAGSALVVGLAPRAT